MNKKITSLPSGWSLATLAEITKIGSQQIFPQDFSDQLLNYVSMENVEKITGQLVNFIPTLGKNIESAKKLFGKGDVLYGKFRPYLQKAIVAPFDGIAATDLVPIRPRDKIDSYYIQNYLLSPYQSREKEN